MPGRVGGNQGEYWTKRPKSLCSCALETRYKGQDRTPKRVRCFSSSPTSSHLALRKILHVCTEKVGSSLGGTPPLLLRAGLEKLQGHPLRHLAGGLGEAPKKKRHTSCKPGRTLREVPPGRPSIHLPSHALALNQVLVRRASAQPYSAIEHVCVCSFNLVTTGVGGGLVLFVAIERNPKEHHHFGGLHLLIYSQDGNHRGSVRMGIGINRFGGPSWQNLCWRPASRAGNPLKGPE